MIQRRRGARLAPKAFERLRIAGHVVGQELQSHEAAKLGVLGLVDDAHTAAAELLDDAVVGNGLADHWAEILGLGMVQVNEWPDVA